MTDSLTKMDRLRVYEDINEQLESVYLPQVTSKVLDIIMRNYVFKALTCDTVLSIVDNDTHLLEIKLNNNKKKRDVVKLIAKYKYHDQYQLNHVTQ